MVTVFNIVLNPHRRYCPHQPVGHANRTDVTAPGAARVKDLEQQHKPDPDQGNSGTVNQCPAENTGGGDRFKNRISGDQRKQREHQIEERAHAAVEAVVPDQFFACQQQVQLFGQLGKQMIGTDPRTEGTATEQHPHDENRHGANHQIEHQVFIGKHHLQRRIQIRHMKADETGGCECTFEDLYVEVIGDHKKQVDQNQRCPAAVTPLGSTRSVLSINRLKIRFGKRVLFFVMMYLLCPGSNLFFGRPGRFGTSQLPQRFDDVTHQCPHFVNIRYSNIAIG